MAADLVISNTRVRTLDPGRPEATAIAIGGGLIEAVGDDRTVRAEIGPNTEVIDGRDLAIVPGLTDNKGVVGPIAKFAASLGNVQRVEVLPFHQMGRFKWERLGLDYTLDRSKAPSDELVEATCAIFRAEGLQAF